VIRAERYIYLGWTQAISPVGSTATICQQAESQKTNGQQIAPK
jgi:hypothetical protein